MNEIYKTSDFTIEVPEVPHIDRLEGGHIKIIPIELVRRIQDLSVPNQIELMRLMSVAGEAYKNAMIKNGVDIGIINYQINGNWSVTKEVGSYLHVHLYGRAKDAKRNKYGEALYFPSMKKQPEYYKNNQTINEQDKKLIRENIETILKKPSYTDSVWGL